MERLHLARLEMVQIKIRAPYRDGKQKKEARAVVRNTNKRFKKDEFYSTAFELYGVGTI